MEITINSIRDQFEKLIDSNTSYSSEEFKSLEEARESLIKRVFDNTRDFEQLTQAMIDDQAEDYDGYLDGARVGHWVFGWDECWVSQTTVDGWLFDSSQLIGKSNNHINDIANYIENDMILDCLTEKNNSEQ